MVDRTMEELLQATTEGYREAIIILEILDENFEIKTNLLQLVQANKFHGFERDNPHTHISNFKRMTTTLKYRDVPNDAIKLMLFSYSLEELTQINTFYNGLTEQDQDSLNAAAGGNLLNKTTREALKIIENKSKIRNNSSVCVETGSFNQMSPPNKASHQIPPPDFAPPSTLGTLPSNTVPNPKGKMKAVTTRSGLAYEGQSIPTESPLEKVNEQNTEEILDKEHSNCSGSTTQVQPLVVAI
nr:reverse transcriptase domain-containing protein [Tanacetum cinerariifolium]